MIYHLTECEAGLYRGRRYVRLESEKLHCSNPDPQHVRQLRLEQVRVVIMAGLKQQVIEYNPLTQPKEHEIAWLYGTAPIINLPWDPVDWKWKRQGTLKEIPFFNYETKYGYKIGLQKIPATMKAMSELRHAGYTNSQGQQLIRLVWHSWLPRKVSSMQWLTLARGLPIGEWRAKAGWDSNCKLCGHNPESTEHALMLCPMVAPAWSYFQALRASSSRPGNYRTWHQIIYGLCTPPGADNIQEEIPWDVSKTTFVSEDTAWEILRH